MYRNENSQNIIYAYITYTKCCMITNSFTIIYAGHVVIQHIQRTEKKLERMNLTQKCVEQN